MSYMNLKAEMTRENVTQEQAAKHLGMTSNNFSMKVREKVPFTIPEIKSLRDEFFPNAQLDYLCQTNDEGR